MNGEGWLVDTRTSYDTVAASYADVVRDLLAETPYERAALALFADFVHAQMTLTSAESPFGGIIFGRRRP
jgi:hypothetical protein